MRPDDIALAQLMWIENQLGSPIGHRVDIAGREPVQAITWLRRGQGALGKQVREKLGRGWDTASRLFAESVLAQDATVCEPGGTTHLVRVSEVLPPAMHQLHDAPIGVRVRGNPQVVSHPFRVAIVGSRRPRADSAACARRMASQLAGSGACIVSGLAIGVDTAAHLGALDAGGATIAVLGSGLDSVHPASNRALAHRIECSQGALVSEYPNLTPARPHQFAARNRLIAALADVVVLIQARHRSGSMITARRALETNADIGAVPGWIGDPEFEGSLALIRDGATVITDANDVRGLLGLPIESSGAAHPIQRHLNAPRSLDELTHLTQASALDLSRSLLDLELAGLVAATPDGRWINRTTVAAP